MIVLVASIALAQEMTYEGQNSGSAANYVAGKPVAVTHSGGNVSVRCFDTDTLSARLQYVVTGTAEGPMQAAGNGVGLAVWGDANGGGVKTRTPSKQSGVSDVDVTLTVNIPRGTSAVTVTQTGRGWVQVLDCSGNVKVSAGAGGAYASGTLTSATVSASGGDVKVDVDANTVLKGTTTVSAPGGNATLILAPAQGGKLTAKGEEVSVQQTVMGTNTGTLVQGDMGVAGPAITVSAKKRAEVTQH
ncbi:MAG: hypothetical protein ACOZNI_24050 [Myxococcota bacterium]